MLSVMCVMDSATTMSVMDLVIKMSVMDLMMTMMSVMGITLVLKTLMAFGTANKMIRWISLVSRPTLRPLVGSVPPQW